MKTIRTTMQPTVELEVSEKEYTDLSRQGLIAGVVGDPADERDPEKALTPDALADAAGKLDLDKHEPEPPADVPDGPGNYGPGQPRTPTKKTRN